MADYDLGTAHGRIVVDYDGKGIQEAERSLDGLDKKSQGLLGRLGSLAKGWSLQSKGMGDDSDTLYQKFVHAGQGMTIAGASIQVLTGHLLSAGKGVKGLDDVAVALGRLPKGAEKFPTLIQHIIQVSAAISMFSAGATLLGRALPHLGAASTALALLTRHVPGVSLLTRGIAALVAHVPGLGLLGRGFTGLGSAVSRIGAPLKFVASAALGVLTVMKGFAVVNQYSKFLNMFFTATTALGAGLHYSIAAIAALAQSIADLGGVLALAPAAIGSAGLAFLTLKVGLTGMGAAFKALAKGDMAALDKAMKNMAPSAREFVTAIKDLGPAWKTIKLDVQQRLFEGLGQVVQNLAGWYLPLLQTRMDSVAGSFNRAAKDVAGFFDNKKVANDFGAGLDLNAKAVDNLTKAFGPLVQAFFTLWRVGSQVFADITTGAGNAAQKFADFLQRARDSGALEAWMRRGVQAVKDLVAGIINLGKIAKTVFEGLGMKTGRSFTQWLKESTDQLNNFLKTAKGQSDLKAIGDWMDRSVAQFKKLADAIINVVLPALQPLFLFFENISSMDAFIAALKVLAPLFKALGDALNAMAPVLSPIVNAIVFLSTIMLGLAIATKIAGTAWLIFRTGMAVVNGISGAIKLIGLLTGQVKLFAAAAGLFKGAVIAAGLFLIADGLDKVNVAAVGGDPSKLNDMNQTLHDITEIGRHLRDGDWEWFGQQLGDIGTEFDTAMQKFQSGESPIGAWWKEIKKELGDVGTFFANLEKTLDDFWAKVTGVTVKKGESPISAWWKDIKSELSDVVAFFAGVEAALDAFWAKVAEGPPPESVKGTAHPADPNQPAQPPPPDNSIGTQVSQAYDTVITNIKTSWGELMGFFSGLPAQVATLGSTLWSGFLLSAQINFGPVITFLQKSPYEMGLAIGSGIGDMATAGGNLITSLGLGVRAKWQELMTWFSTAPTAIATSLGSATVSLFQAGYNMINGLILGAQTKWNEFQIWLSTLATSVALGLAGFGVSLFTTAYNAFEQFRLGAVAKFIEFSVWLSELPARCGEMLSGLGATLGQKAQEAFDQFKNTTRQKLDEVEAEVSSWPGRAGAALSSLAGILITKAKEALDGFGRGITTGIDVAMGFISSIPGRITSAIGSLGSLLIGAGRSLIDGLLSGIRAGVQAMYDFVSGIAAGIAARKGPINKDKTLLVPAGNAIIQGLMRGMQQSMPALWSMISGINSDLSGIGGIAGRVNLTPLGGSMGSMTASPSISSSRVRGSDGSSSGDTFTIGQVTIPAADIKEFRDVTDFFAAVKQKSRAGRATR